VKSNEKNGCACKIASEISWRSNIALAMKLRSKSCISHLNVTFPAKCDLIFLAVKKQMQLKWREKEDVCKIKQWVLKEMISIRTDHE
jgi:hypothetical protein